MPFIPDTPTPKAGGFMADAPVDQPTAPQGPFRYTSATGEPVASPSQYDPGKDPFASQGPIQTLARNLPTSPALMEAGALAAPMVGAPALVGQMVGAGIIGAGESPQHPLTGAGIGAALTGLLGGVGWGTGKILGRQADAFEWAQSKL